MLLLDKRVSSFLETLCSLEFFSRLYAGDYINQRNNGIAGERQQTTHDNEKFQTLVVRLHLPSPLLRVVLFSPDLVLRKKVGISST